MRLSIPSIGVDHSIVGVPLGDDGWDTDWLGDQVGYLEGTSFPTWTGNTVLTAHNYTSDGTPGPFVDLPSLKWGDQIILYAHGQRYTYEVRDSKLVSPRDYTILEHKDRDWLTLFTCYQYDEASDGYLWRHVVQAVLIEIESLE
jgi:LPXTG-site transpeptidase (sortase) family protein